MVAERIDRQTGMDVEIVTYLDELHHWGPIIEGVHLFTFLLALVILILLRSCSSKCTAVAPDCALKCGVQGEQLK